MGNGFTKLTHCFSPSRPRPRPCRRIDSAAVTSEPLDEGLGHSFCYVTTTITPTTTPTFYSISGAAVSANTSTALSTSLPYDSLPSSAFDSSTSFSSYPLYPVPRFSGPIDRGFLSGPLDPRSSSSALFSGPLHLNKHSNSSQLRRSFSHGGRLIRNLSKAIGRTVSVPVKVLSKQDSLNSNSPGGSSSGSVKISDEVDDSNNNCQWAQGKAGEDRVHVVVSEEHGWLFVGIYDGFNGPDATDYLLSNLYSAIRRELEGLLWVDKGEGERCGGEKRVQWKCDWEGEGLEKPNHSEVLKAMNEGLRRTEEGFLGIADEVFVENPELALMGSCVLVAMMKGEDLYVMNIGDSRAILGHKDLERVREGSLNNFGLDFSPTLSALQLTLDHSTCVEEEVRRIRSEHPDDECAVMNDRVKGSLKVTRAFGAGFLKQPKWNDALLEVFRIDYVGSSPYITCNPFLHHHRLGPRDKFLILSSDGLYQYFTNEEAVAQVELFISLTPEGDPAQHLVEEVIFRAAKKAGLDFHELLEIPQGDRRRYHDDVSIIVISFEGRIWRSCV